MTAVVLDAEAVSRLARQPQADRTRVRVAMEAAARLGHDVIVPAVVLAELYRGPRHDPVVDACLSRETGIDVRDTDRALARAVGGVLTAAGSGSEDMVDAHVVAVAAESDRGVVLTGDLDDLTRLSAGYSSVVVQEL
ncbi:MAG: PIN domain-containing protein [Iamia sp.]